MYVRQMLPAARQHLATVGQDASLGEIARLLSQEHVNLVVVCDDQGRMSGVVSDSDVVRGVAMCGGSHYACRVRAKRVMSPDVISCTPTETLRTVWAAMKQRCLRHVPVLDEEGKPVGVLNARDVLSNLVEEVEYQERETVSYFLGLGYH